MSSTRKQDANKPTKTSNPSSSQVIYNRISSPELLRSQSAPAHNSIKRSSAINIIQPPLKEETFPKSTIPNTYDVTAIMNQLHKNEEKKPAPTKQKISIQSPTSPYVLIQKNPQNPFVIEDTAIFKFSSSDDETSLTKNEKIETPIDSESSEEQDEEEEKAQKQQSTAKENSATSDNEENDSFQFSFSHSNSR